MKHFALSLLSRGYGHVVQNDDGHEGRLEVCFEPEDYFNWKSQPPVLRLTSSGRFFGGLEPVPPKTYSTRRGPLILFSEDLAMPHQSGQVNRKRKTPGCPKQDSEGRLHTLQDLTGAILAFGKRKSKVGSLAAVTHPLLPDTKHIHNIHMRQRAGEKSCNPNQVKGEKAGQVRYQPHFLCSPWPSRPTVGSLPLITEGLVHVQPQEKNPAVEDEQVTFRTKEQKDQPREKLKEKKALMTVRIEADTSRAQMSPDTESQPTAHQTEDQIVPAETREITTTTLPHVTDHSKDPNGRGKRSRRDSGGGIGETCALKSVYVDSSLDYTPLSRVNYYGGHMEGSRHRRHFRSETHGRRVKIETDPSIKVFHLPPINQNPQVNSGSDPTLTTMNKPEVEDKKRSHENLPQRELHVHLPDIKAGAADGGTSERHVHSKVLLLFPAQTQHTDSHQPDDELHKTHVKETEACGDVKHDDQRAQEPLTDSRCRIIEMDLGPVMGSDHLQKGDQPHPVCALAPLQGRRGPGKQSSMAVYRQSLCEAAETTDAQTGNTRGCIPLELREWQGGKSVGTLIMGPDGEIIRLSLWDPTADTEDHPIMAEVTQGHVLRVVTSEGGLKQPWTILIQDEAIDKEETTTSDSEETTSDTEKLDPSREVLKINKPKWKTNAKKSQHSLASHSQRVNTHGDASEAEKEEEEEEEENDDEEEESETDEEDEDSLHSDNRLVFRVKAPERLNEAEDHKEDLESDSQIIQQEQVFQVRSRAKQSKSKRKEECLANDNEIIQDEFQVANVRSRAKQMKNKKKGNCLDAVELPEEEQVFKLRSRAKQTKTRRKEDCSGADSEIIHEEEVIKARSHAKRTKAKMKEDFCGSAEFIQDAQVCLPEEGSEEMSSSTTHRLNKTTGEKATGAQINRRVKTTALQQETEVTRGSRKSKGAVPAIGPKSTDFIPRAHSPESVSPEERPEFQMGLPDETEEGRSRNTDAEDTLVEKKKNKKSNKQTGKSKGKTVQIQEDAEIRNTTVHDDPNSTAKKKKRKSDKQKKEEVDEEKEEPIKSQKPIVKVKKKKKGQPAFVVGKPRPQEVEWITNSEDEPETQMTPKREVTAHDTEDDQLENTENTDQSDIDSEDDTGADTDSLEDSPRPVSSAHRSQRSHITARSDSSIHRRSHSSIRSGSVGTMYSPAPLSLIHLPPQSAQRPASEHTTPESNHTKTEPEHNRSQPDIDVKSGAVPINQKDKKAAALAERAERRRLEVEKKRREKEEERKRQQEKEATEERMRLELEEEQRKRAEEARSRKIREEDERRRRQEEEEERQRREQAEKERERRRQEEKRRMLERLQRERHEEEKRQAAELERQRLEEEAQKEEERRKLSEMEEAERLEYLRRQQEEEEERRKAAEERRRNEEEAAMLAQQEARLQAELFARQRAALEQNLKFHRGLFVEAEGLEQTQDISRPWLFSYFTLLKMLGLAEPTPEDMLPELQ